MWLIMRLKGSIWAIIHPGVDEVFDNHLSEMSYVLQLQHTTRVQAIHCTGDVCIAFLWERLYNQKLILPVLEVGLEDLIP